MLVHKLLNKPIQTFFSAHTVRKFFQSITYISFNVFKTTALILLIMMSLDKSGVSPDGKLIMFCCDTSKTTKTDPQVLCQKSVKIDYVGISQSSAFTHRQSDRRKHGGGNWSNENGWCFLIYLPVRRQNLLTLLEIRSVLILEQKCDDKNHCACYTPSFSMPLEPQ